jgi:hypothetical protein
VHQSTCVIKQNPLKTREDLQMACLQLLEPLRGKYSNGGALLNLGTTSAFYKSKISQMEAFARPLWGLSPLLAGGCQADYFVDIYLKGLKNGTNPLHEEYWRLISDSDQRMVEMAAIALALILIPDKIWDPLSEIEKLNLYKWLNQINEKEPSDNNWLFFRILVNTAFDTLHLPFSREIQEKAFNRIEDFYLGDGWYQDGKHDQIDYYVPFGFHFYSLLYAQIMEKKDPVRSQLYKERAKQFAKEFIYWFSQDGSAIPFGRSMTYRFAQGSFWSALAFANQDVFSWGIMKGIVLRHLRWWFQQPIFTNDGLLTIGYAYPNLEMAEEYNAPGSPYWALKIFLILALDENHPFWLADEEPLPKLEKIKVLKQPKMVICREEEHVYALTSGQYVHFEPAHNAEKYAKFAYSNVFGFSVPKSTFNLSQGAFDSMLVFSEDGHFFRGRRECEAVQMKGDLIHSVWKPWSNVVVNTWLVPLGSWHIRIHRIMTESTLFTAEGGFSIASDKGTSFDDLHEEEVKDQRSILSVLPWGVSGIVNLSGNRESILLITHPNTNVIHSSGSLLPTLIGNIDPGESLFITAVLAHSIPHAGGNLWSSKPKIKMVNDELFIFNSLGEEVTNITLRKK